MVSGSNLSCPASIPAPCLWPGKAIDDGPNPWDPAPVWETWKSSWLQIDEAPAIVVTWRVNRQMEDLPLCLSFSLYIADIAIKINLFFFKDLFVFIGNPDIQRIFHPMIHYTSDCNGWSLANLFFYEISG